MADQEEVDWIIFNKMKELIDAGVSEGSFSEAWKCFVDSQEPEMAQALRANSFVEVSRLIGELARTVHNGEPVSESLGEALHNGGSASFEGDRREVSRLLWMAAAMLRDASNGIETPPGPRGHN